jgi:hypothetical protein
MEDMKKTYAVLTVLILSASLLYLYEFSPTGTIVGAQCLSNVDCSSGEGCVSGACQILSSGCIGDFDCDIGFYCDSGDCVSYVTETECRSNFDCSSGQYCDEYGDCVTMANTCSVNSDCDVGKSCSSGKCIDSSQDPTLANSKIAEAETAISSAKTNKLDVSEAEEYLSQAKASLNAGLYADALNKATTAKIRALSARPIGVETSMTQEEIDALAAVESAQIVISSKSSSDPYIIQANTMLNQATIAINTGDYSLAKERADTAASLASLAGLDSSDEPQDYSEYYVYIILFVMILFGIASLVVVHSFVVKILEHIDKPQA